MLLCSKRNSEDGRYKVRQHVWYQCRCLVKAYFACFNMLNWIFCKTNAVAQWRQRFGRMETSAAQSKSLHFMVYFPTTADHPRIIRCWCWISARHLAHARTQMPAMLFKQTSDLHVTKLHFFFCLVGVKMHWKMMLFHHNMKGNHGGTICWAAWRSEDCFPKEETYGEAPNKLPTRHTYLRRRCACHRKSLHKGGAAFGGMC